jgi:hypothetical protein
MERAADLLGLTGQERQVAMAGARRIKLLGDLSSLAGQTFDETLARSRTAAQAKEARAGILAKAQEHRDALAVAALAGEMILDFAKGSHELGDHVSVIDIPRPLETTPGEPTFDPEHLALLLTPEEIVQGFPKPVHGHDGLLEWPTRIMQPLLPSPIDRTFDQLEADGLNADKESEPDECASTDLRSPDAPGERSVVRGSPGGRPDKANRKAQKR